MVSYVCTGGMPLETSNVLSSFKLGSASVLLEITAQAQNCHAWLTRIAMAEANSESQKRNMLVAIARFVIDHKAHQSLCFFPGHIIQYNICRKSLRKASEVA